MNAPPPTGRAWLENGLTSGDVLIPKDPDPQVRSTAASLLARTAAPDRIRAALEAATDPVVRIALLDAMTDHAITERLRSDPVPAVRVLAGLAAYTRDDPDAWPALDAAIRADLDACAGVLDAPEHRSTLTAGERWAWKMVSLDREEDCYAWAQRLAAPAEKTTINLEGVRMAKRALRTWRAAPARLTPTLIGLLDGPARPEALRAVAASLTASSLAADALLPVLDDPALGPVAAMALGAAGDHRAVPHLVRLMLAGSDKLRLWEAFRVIARSGADPSAPVAAARQILAGLPGSVSPCVPMRVLAAFGPAAAPAVPELIARLEGAENDTPDHAIQVLGSIGPAAAEAVPSLRHYSTQGATSALIRITGDRSPAERYLAGRPEEVKHGRFAAELLTWLAEHGGLTTRQHRQARSLFRIPGFGQAAVAGALWLHEGPAASAELLDALPQYLTCGLRGPAALRALTMMGAHARPVLGRLDRFVTSRCRTVYTSGGDEDVAMRVDEAMLAEVVAARKVIAGAGQ